jgi:hypothetical protein
MLLKVSLFTNTDLYNTTSPYTNKNYKKVKYAYPEWPHPTDTAAPHSQKVGRRREHGYTMINFKIDTTNT